jgi:Protein of unknown function (DUF4229)
VKEFWIYTGLRVLLFLASFGIVVGVWFLLADEVPILPALLIAIVASGIGSYFLLSHPREQLARRVQSRAEQMTAKMDEIKAREDQD